MHILFTEQNLSGLEITIFLVANQTLPIVNGRILNQPKNSWRVIFKSLQQINLDGWEKIKILKIGARYVQRWVSTCTKPNLRSVAAQRRERRKVFDFFAGEVL